MQDLKPQNEAAEGSGSTGQPTPSSERVFISYAREDEAFVLRLARALKARGIPIWLDQWDIPPGADWNQSIDRALHESRKVIAVLSPAAVASRQVRAEIQSAVDAEEKTLFPVLHKDCQVPRILTLYQFSDFREPRNFEPELARLAEALGTGEKSPPPKPPSPPPFWRAFVTKVGRLMYRRPMPPSIVGAAVIAAILVVLAVGFLIAPSVGPTPGVTPGERKTEAHPSEQAGNLQVSVNVHEARVSLDGAEVGIARNAVPLILKGLSPGEHRLQVEAKGYVPEEREITIIANRWTLEGVALRQPSPAPVGR